MPLLPLKNGTIPQCFVVCKRGCWLVWAPSLLYTIIVINSPHHSAPTYSQFDPGHQVPTVLALHLAGSGLRQARSEVSWPVRPFAVHMYRIPFAFWLIF